MLSWSITFLIIGLVAGLLGISGVAGGGYPDRLCAVCRLSHQRACQLHYGKEAPGLSGAPRLYSRGPFVSSAEPA